MGFVSCGTPYGIADVRAAYGKPRDAFETICREPYKPQVTPRKPSYRAAPGYQMRFLERVAQVWNKGPTWKT